MHAEKMCQFCREEKAEERRTHRPSWTGGVAARSSKYREASLFAQTGWLIQKKLLLIHHPGASRHPSCPGGAMLPPS
jgi:hypothetical protein